MPRKHGSKHISTLSTVVGPSTGDRRIFPLMSLNPLASVFLHDYQPPSGPPISRCNSTTRSVPWLDFFPECLGHSSHLMVLLLTNPSLTAFSSSLLFCRQVTLSRMQQLIHYFLDLYLFFLHLSNIKRTVYRLFTRASNSSTNTWRENNSTDKHHNSLSFNCGLTAFLRHLLFSSIGTTSNKDIAANNSATSPLINPNPNLNPTPTALQLLCADAPKFRRSTPVGAVGTPGGKTNNSANDDFQPTFNMQEAPPTTVQNLTSGISKLENYLRMK